MPRCQLSPLAHPAPNKCELNCIPKGQNFYYKHKDAVVDGTPCEPGQRDICVDGICRVSSAPPSWRGWGLLWMVSSSISGTKWLSGAWWLKSQFPECNAVITENTDLIKETLWMAKVALNQTQPNGKGWL